MSIVEDEAFKLLKSSRLGHKLPVWCPRKEVLCTSSSHSPVRPLAKQDSNGDAHNAHCDAHNYRHPRLLSRAPEQPSMEPRVIVSRRQMALFRGDGELGASHSLPGQLVLRNTLEEDGHQHHKEGEAAQEGEEDPGKQLRVLAAQDQVPAEIQ